MDHRILPANGLLSAPEEGGAPDSFEGYLRCPCGGEHFCVYHNGVRHSKWLQLWSGNRMKPAGGQPLVLEARCTRCGNAVTLHCTERDEQGWLLPASPQMEELILPAPHSGQSRLYVWYCWDEDAEQTGGQYLATYTLFSLGARCPGRTKLLHIYEDHR